MSFTAIMHFYCQNPTCLYLSFLRVIHHHMGNRVPLTSPARSRVIAFWKRRAHTTKFHEICVRRSFPASVGKREGVGGTGWWRAHHHYHHHCLCSWVAETWWWLAAILLLLAHCHSICLMRQLTLLLLLLLQTLLFFFFSFFFVKLLYFPELRRVWDTSIHR